MGRLRYSIGFWKPIFVVQLTAKRMVNFIDWVEYWYNTTYQGPVKCTHYEVVYGRAPPSLTQFIQRETAVEAVAQDLMSRDEALKQLKFHLRRGQDQMSKFVNRHRRKVDIGVGDMVYLKIQPHQQQLVHTKLHPKLSARYYGPFLVIARVRAVAYRLQFPDHIRIHPVFHVSQLKKAVGDHHVESEMPPDLQGQRQEMISEEILGRRIVTTHGSPIEQVLIRWKEGGAAAAMWEDIEMIKEQFPEIHLEDKVVDLEGSIVRLEDQHKVVQHSPDRIWRVYEGRIKNRKG